MRDTVGFAVDTVAFSLLTGEIIDAVGAPDWTPYALAGVGLLDQRAHLEFRYYETGTFYEYLWVRQIQKELRQFEVDK